MSYVLLTVEGQKSQPECCVGFDNYLTSIVFDLRKSQLINLALFLENVIWVLGNLWFNDRRGSDLCWLIGQQYEALPKLHAYSESGRQERVDLSARFS